MNQPHARLVDVARARKKTNYKTVSTVCHGYFDRYYEALDFAESLNVGRVYECEFCSPRHANESRGRKRGG